MGRGYQALGLCGVGAAAFLIAHASRIQGFQGMTSPTRKGRAVEVTTNLPPIQVDFRDVAEAAGLRAINVSGGVSRKKYLIEATGNGVVIFDFDNDGLMDVFLVSGTTLDRKGPGAGATSHLYRNLGNLHFEDVTQKAGLARNGWGQGACAADYDNDGRRDLFVTYYGQSVLYHNEGNGTFRDVTQAAGLASAKTRWDTGCSFVDYDLDGKLDLVVTGYVDFDPAKAPAPGTSDNCKWKGMPVMCGPRGLPNGRNFLFHNNGNGLHRCLFHERNRQADFLLRLHRHRIGLRQRRLPRYLRGMRFDVQPALPQSQERHVRRDRPGLRRGSERGRPGAGRYGGGGGRLRRRRLLRYREDQLQRRYLRTSTATTGTERFPIAYMPRGSAHAPSTWGGAFTSSTSITTGGRNC